MDKLAQEFADLAKQYAPAVGDAAMRAARIEAYSSLAAGALTLIFAGAMLCGAFWLARKAFSGDWDEITFLPAGILCIVGIIALCAGLWSFVDPWTWVTIQHPELWIAKRAFGL